MQIHVIVIKKDRKQIRVIVISYLEEVTIFHWSYSSLTLFISSIVVFDFYSHDHFLFHLPILPSKLPDTDNFRTENS